MDAHPIITPPDWNAQKDVKFFWDWCPWSEVHDCFGTLFDAIAVRYEQLTDAVDQVIRYFEQRDHKLVRTQSLPLTLSEKLTRLSAIVSTRNGTYQYHAHMGGALYCCERADQERKRILESYYLRSEATWLQPFCALHDWLVFARMELEETMLGEHSDYRETDA